MKLYKEVELGPVLKCNDIYPNTGGSALMPISNGINNSFHMYMGIHPDYKYHTVEENEGEGSWHKQSVQYVWINNVNSREECYLVASHYLFEFLSKLNSEGHYPLKTESHDKD